MGTTDTLILIANCTFLVPGSPCAQDTPRAHCFSHTERALYLSLSAALLDFSSNKFESALVFSYVGAGRHRSGIPDWCKPLHTLVIQCNGYTFVTTFTSETMHLSELTNICDNNTCARAPWHSGWKHTLYKF